MVDVRIRRIRLELGSTAYGEYLLSLLLNNRWLRRRMDFKCNDLQVQGHLYMQAAMEKLILGGLVKARV